MTGECKLDMTMMFAFHEALRRDLEQISHMEARSDGWDLFETLLHVHHTVEDDALWPVVRDAVHDRPDDLALLDEMAAEHAALGPLLDAITTALASGESAPRDRAELATKLQEHLADEEKAALPLIDATLTEQQWMTFGMTATQRVGPNMPQFLPWLLEGADDDTTARVLAIVPEPVRENYRVEWQPAYAANDWWAADSSV